MAQHKWKEFDDNLLTHSAAHYLMTINELIQEHGYARVTDIAKALNITRGSCSISLKPLKKRGLVVEDENKFLQLSEEGQRLAKLIEKNDELLEMLFRDILGVSREQAEIDACKIEHLISIETSVKLARFVSFLRQDTPAVRQVMEDLHRLPNHCEPNDVANCAVCTDACAYESAAHTPCGNHPKMKEPSWN